MQAATGQRTTPAPDSKFAEYSALGRRIMHACGEPDDQKYIDPCLWIDLVRKTLRLKPAAERDFGNILGKEFRQLVVLGAKSIIFYAEHGEDAASTRRNITNGWISQFCEIIECSGSSGLFWCKLTREELVEITLSLAPVVTFAQAVEPSLARRIARFLHPSAETLSRGVRRVVRASQ